MWTHEEVEIQLKSPPGSPGRLKHTEKYISIGLEGDTQVFVCSAFICGVFFSKLMQFILTNLLLPSFLGSV